MRVTAETTLLDLAPGQAGDVMLEVVNTGPVIDGITARVVGLPARHVTSRPEVLALFPEALGNLTLTLALPETFPAGRHPLTVQLHSRQADVPPGYVDLDLDVPATPRLTIDPHPSQVRARRTARFVLTLVNHGNVALEVALTASDPERAVSLTLEPATVWVAAGHARDVQLLAKGPRHLLGGVIERQLAVAGTARVADPYQPLAPELPQPEADAEPVGGRTPIPPLTVDCRLAFRQRPWFTRGLLTALILLSIIALWALVFLFGIAQVFAGDPVTKQAPASFFISGTATTPASAGAGGAALPGGAGAAAAVAPAGALPKSGVMPAGLGGTIAGTVTAASDGSPVGRILVEALRTTRGGAFQVVASAATQADGSYQIAGLFPGPYLLRFSADGFVTGFHSDSAIPAPDQTGAAAVPAAAAAVTAGVDQVIAGKPATITGAIDPGDTLTPVTATVTVRPLTGPGQGTTVATTTTDPATGAYTVPNLPAPGNYQLTFTADGYQPTESQATVNGGAQRIQPTVLLGSGLGAIGGTVTDGAAPLGGVTVATTVSGSAITTGTPTTGTVGAFALGSLPTPATYVLTFTADGFGTTTVVVDLSSGQQRTDLAVVLTRGTGTVGGHLVDPAGNGLGGAVVTVGGGTSSSGTAPAGTAADPSGAGTAGAGTATQNQPSTTTLTAGDVGAFSIAGLPTPGTYTLTFTLAGYAPTTVPVQLTGTAAAAPMTVTMARSLGSITGTVIDSAGNPVIGAAVVATDGRQKWPVTSTAASGGVPAGGYVIDSLPPGVYTVTVTAAGGASADAGGDTAATGTDGSGTDDAGATTRTRIIVVDPGLPSTADFSLPGSG